MDPSVAAAAAAGKPGLRFDAHLAPPRPPKLERPHARLSLGALAATLNVNSTSVAYVAGDGLCTLSEAVDKANFDDRALASFVPVIRTRDPAPDGLIQEHRGRPFTRCAEFKGQFRTPGFPPSQKRLPQPSRPSFRPSFRRRAPGIEARHPHGPSQQAS
jgi:hypothetical protein